MGNGIEVKLFSKSEADAKDESSEPEFKYLSANYCTQMRSFTAPADIPSAIRAAYASRGSAGGYGIDANGRGYVISGANGVASDRSWASPMIADVKFATVFNSSELKAITTYDVVTTPRAIFFLGTPHVWKDDAQPTVAAVPTTGAPSSDIALPAALLAAGMVGGGLLIHKRRDHARA